MSVPEMIPSTSSPSSITGAPETPSSSIILSTSRTVWSGEAVTTSLMISSSARLTCSIWVAISSTPRFRWRTPSPPWRAIAMAISASVTVSIAAERTGTVSSTCCETRVAVSASSGST